MSGFGTIESLKKKKGKKADDEDEPNEYYVGGNTRQGGSGLNVVERPDEHTPIDDIFNLARSQNFSPSDDNAVTVAMYSNGFTVGEGPFRPFGVPENDSFAAEIAKGYCPKELVKNGKPQNVKLVDKRKEKFEEVERFQAFGGHGNQVKVGKKSVKDSDFITDLSNAEPVNIDNKKAKIRVRVSYPDKSKKVELFEEHHTVKDLINVIKLSGKITERFYLEGPKRDVITKDSFGLTLKEAGLANANVTVQVDNI